MALNANEILEEPIHLSTTVIEHYCELFLKQIDCLVYIPPRSNNISYISYVVNYFVPSSGKKTQTFKHLSDAVTYYNSCGKDLYET